MLVTLTASDDVIFTLLLYHQIRFLTISIDGIGGKT